MEQNTKTAPDVMSIVAEPGALTFVTRKEWQRLPECCLGELIHYETVKVFCGNGSVFFLLRDMYPDEYLADTGISFRLVRVSIDEETGKQTFSIMNLSRAEAEQLRRNRLTLWE